MNQARRFFVLTLVLLLLATPALADRFNYDNLKVKTILNNGPSAQKFDIVFVGDGFLPRTRSQYDSKVRSCLSTLWSVSPFRELKSRFNVHVVYIDSLPGQGYGPDGRRKAEFPFGSQYKNDGSGMVLLSKPDKVREAAKNAPQADAIIVITTLSGRSHAGGMVLIADDQSALPHELGHLIGHLGDEYSSTSKLIDRERHRLPSNRPLPYPNIQIDKSIDTSSRKTIQKTAKWGHLLELPDSDPIVSAYQGGFYREVGVWRPSYSCVMRSSQGAIFCPVCHEEMYKSILRKCGERFHHESYHKQFPLTKWKTKMY